ncbi:MAG: type I 3-dehydroquinate dehydratase [Streptococcaceae bacterium]|jgi:3-dehydroquinate dehydratase-1|nr:type I 3-dehydroquinate dehydratase [Streptococcaceae bacterium]
MPKFICSFFPESLSDIEKADLSVFSAVDMIEWRADAMPADEILRAASLFFEKFKNFPVLFTLRTVTEGGNFDQPDLVYHYILQRILTEYTPTFVDVEALSKPEVLDKLQAFMPKLWLSYHNFHQMPDDLVSMMADLAEKKPAAVKIAVEAQHHPEVWQLLLTAEIFRESYTTPLIAIALGPLGRISRLIERSPWTFVSLDGEAPRYGQFTLSETKQMLRVLNDEKE